MKPKRILMVCEPGEYGVLMYLQKLIGYLHAHHSEVLVDYLYSSRRSSEQQLQLIAAVKSRGGLTLDLKVGNGPEPGDVNAFFQVIRTVYRGRPDLIHAHSSKAGILCRAPAIFPGFPPVLYSPHGYYGMAGRTGLKNRFFNFLETLFGRIGKTHNVSNYERSFAITTLGLPEDRLLAILSGINRSLFHPVDAEQKRRLRQQLGLPEHGKLLVTVGREGYEKNQAAIYQALPKGLADDECFFAHAGFGADKLKSALDSSTRSKVYTYTFLEKPYELLQSADGFIMTSRSEAFGLAAFEALCCGLPLILTSTTGLLTVKDVTSAVVRWLPNPTEVENITDEVVAAIQAWAAAVPQDCSAQVAEAALEFDETKQFDKLFELYRTLADRN